MIDLKRIARWLGVSVDIVKPSLSQTVFTNELDADQANKAASWWKEDYYTQVQRYKRIKWLGVPLLKLPYQETVDGNYWKPDNDIVELITEMQNAGLISEISQHSKIFEPGCNVGRNLYALQQAFGCTVVGLDISEQAINLAREKYWQGNENCEFYIDNALTSDFFADIEDKAFDLVITRWHLIHIPRSQLKQAYVQNLKRVGKVLLIIEPIKEDAQQQIYISGEGTYALSWDNWESEYGLQAYKTTNIPSIIDGNTRVFYSINQ